MTGTTHGGRPGQPPRDLAARLFRALYSDFELRTLGGEHVAIPRGTPWYAGHNLSDVARQISSALPRGPDPELRDQAHPRQV
jgi:hypothetical protein